MKTNHNFFSNLAFDLAEKNLGKTKTNPSVGCVVVKNNSVISSAVTSINGRPHAEYNALNKNINFRNSKMYLTLEPCTHFGLTPPCTSIIKKKKIKKIFYSFDDPDERTFKKAKKVLKQKIEKLNKIKLRNKDFYKSYYLNKKKKFPLVDAKIAISKDYFTISKKSKWITNTRSRKVAHLIRSRYDCILATSKSINVDNSLLNCRIEGLNKNKPDLIIIDRFLKLKKNLKIYNSVGKRKIYILTCVLDKKKISFFKKRNIKIIKIGKLESKKDFRELLIKIFQMGIGRILIETGLIFIEKLLKFKLIDEFYVFKSNHYLKGSGTNNSNTNPIKGLNLSKSVKVNLDKDRLYRIKLK